MLIGADDDRNSSAVWLTQYKLAEAQCVGKHVPIAPDLCDLFAQCHARLRRMGMCARAHPLLACTLELRQGKLQVEAFWSNVGQAVDSEIFVWEALHI